MKGPLPALEAATADQGRQREKTEPQTETMKTIFKDFPCGTIAVAGRNAPTALIAKRVVLLDDESAPRSRDREARCDSHVSDDSDLKPDGQEAHLGDGD